jgi:hypothetical protein
MVYLSRAVFFEGLPVQHSPSSMFQRKVETLVWYQKSDVAQKLQAVAAQFFDSEKR